MATVDKLSGLQDMIKDRFQCTKTSLGLLDGRIDENRCKGFSVIVIREYDPQDFQLPIAQGMRVFGLFGERTWVVTSWIGRVIT